MLVSCRFMAKEAGTFDRWIPAIVWVSSGITSSDRSYYTCIDPLLGWLNENLGIQVDLKVAVSRSVFQHFDRRSRLGLVESGR